ncbi:hypothetical protein CCMA1212_006770 [Trichoderma ghanense]|uniref:Uncharacterized protein n=1 Tax=Trichoderma ghanense TaxID=65468 RepID=A0ABY2H0H0_9HYPO
MRPGSGFGAPVHTGCHPAAPTAFQWVIMACCEESRWRVEGVASRAIHGGQRGPLEGTLVSTRDSTVTRAVGLVGQAGRTASCYYQMHIIRVEARMRGDREIDWPPLSPFGWFSEKAAAIRAVCSRGPVWRRSGGDQLGEIGDAGPHLLALILLALAWRSSLYAPQISLALPSSRQMPD